LILAKTLPITAKKWTDEGQLHDSRGLKQRDANAVRPVPVLPRLVRILRSQVVGGCPIRGRLAGQVSLASRGGATAMRGRRAVVLVSRNPWHGGCLVSGFCDRSPISE